MPTSLISRLRLDGRSNRSSGIIQNAALWVLCRYRHKAHWSGSKDRLNRDLSGRFGSHDYAREELRAELAQVMICSELGIDDCDFTNGAAYIADWLSNLRDDKKEVFRAASDAQRIADYLLAFHPAYAERGRAGGEEHVDQEPEASVESAAATLREAA